MTPEFDRRNAIVLGSSYWDVEGEDYDKHIRLKEDGFLPLKRAIQDANTYDDLDEKMRSILDRAEAVAKADAKHEAEFGEWYRQQEQDPKTSEGYGRLLGHEAPGPVKAPKKAEK